MLCSSAMSSGPSPHGSAVCPMFYSQLFIPPQRKQIKCHGDFPCARYLTTPATAERLAPPVAHPPFATCLNMRSRQWSRENVVSDTEFAVWGFLRTRAWSLIGRRRRPCWDDVEALSSQQDGLKAAPLMPTT